MSRDRVRGNGLVPSDGRGEPLVVSLAEDGSPGAAVARSAAHQGAGVLHLAVSLQVVDPDGERWLIQRRAAAKALFPNRWSNTCCTHPAPGEDPARAAMRRLREETGIVVGEVLAAGSFTYRARDHQSGLVEHEHDHVFVALADTESACPDPAEIGELALVPFEDALHIVRSDHGAPWAAEVLERSRSALSAWRGRSLTSDQPSWPIASQGRRRA